jgi:RNA polymerase sigma factor FliA
MDMLYKKPTTAYVTAARQMAVGLSAGEREALVESHLPQVKFIAERLAAKLPPSVERDDLIGAGVLGLLDAVDKFDPTRGVQFKTYAELRIRGAMLDCLRSLDWAPRALRQRAREIEAAFLKIEREKGRPAEAEDVARELGISTDQYQSLLQELRGITLLGLDANTDEDDQPFPQIADDPSQSPFVLYEQAEGRERLIEAIDHLPPRERQVVALYYLEELTMKEVGAVLGITESRVSQLHTQAMLHLRVSLASQPAALRQLQGIKRH